MHLVKQYCLKYKGLIIFILALKILATAIELAIPMAFVHMVNQIVPKNSMGLLYQWGSLMILIAIVSTLMSLFMAHLSAKLGVYISNHLRVDLFEKSYSLSCEQIDNITISSITSRLTSDISSIQMFIMKMLTKGVKMIITLVGSLTSVALLDMKLATIMFIAIPLIGIVVYMTTTVSFTRFKLTKKANDELVKTIRENVMRIRVIKALSKNEHEEQRFEKANHVFREKNISASVSEFLGGAVLRNALTFITTATTALIYVHGCILLLKNEITLAQISSFILYAKMFTGIVNEITTIMADIQAALAAADRVFDFIDETEEIIDSSPEQVLENPKGNIVLNNVRFQYDQHRAILKDINIQARQNKVIAIVGHTGAGKTTLINLLMRFYDVTSGEITFDNKDIKDVTRKSLRSSCAMVLQDTWLFGGTIFENIAYGDSQATLEQVIKVSKAIGLHQHIERLPNQYNTMITENTVNISQGQKQLITIARAMLLDAKVLILDEATSNIDTLTEIEIQKSMKRLMRGKTCFVIAHRLSTVKNADSIIVLDQGEIIEQGTHNELLQLKGSYASLYHSQFEVLENMKKIG